MKDNLLKGSPKDQEPANKDIFPLFDFQLTYETHTDPYNCPPEV